jgi:hypothetical protein
LPNASGLHDQQATLRCRHSAFAVAEVNASLPSHLHQVRASLVPSCCQHTACTAKCHLQVLSYVLLRTDQTCEPLFQSGCECPVLSFSVQPSPSPANLTDVNAFLSVMRCTHATTQAASLCVQVSVRALTQQAQGAAPAPPRHGQRRRAAPPAPQAPRAWPCSSRSHLPQTQSCRARSKGSR